MEKVSLDKLTLFADNTQALRKGGFGWHDAMTRRLAALLYAREKKRVDGEAIKHCHSLIKKSVGVFSSFRGNLALALATLLSLSPDPQKVLDESLKVYGLLKDVRFRSSDYLAMTAYEIASQSSPADHDRVVARTRSFYDGMKAYRFFRIGESAYIFSAMLGLSNLDVEQATRRIEDIYTRLKGEFWSKDSVMTLAQVLVLGGSDDDSIDHVLTLRDALRSKRIKLDKAYVLPSLGILAMLPVETDVIVSDLYDAQKSLRATKGFSSWSVSTQELLMYASAIVAYDHACGLPDDALSATVTTTIANLLIAQQVAMIMIMLTTTMAAASAASS